jgi:acetoin utilization deacetylase AcuC-like enzyme
MFVLRFHRMVRETLDWTEAPGMTFVNTHQSVLSKRKKQSLEQYMCGQDCEECRLYIQDTYPRYFGVTLRIGEAVVKNRHLVANHPPLHHALDPSPHWMASRLFEPVPQ